MRSFGSGFTTKLASSSYLPVVFCKYELITYVSGATAGTGTKTTTNYYWSERGITYDSQAYEARLINTSPLEQSLDESNQVFGEMGLQIANSPTNLAGAIQAGMKCTVYLGFEDTAGSGTVTDAEEMFVGVVEGSIEITEDSVSFNLEDIAHTYDKQLPELITRDEYPYADPDSVGDTKPIIMGRVRDLVTRPVASGFASVLAFDVFIESFVYVTDDIGWWQDAIVGSETGTYPVMTINTSGEGDEEDIQINSIEFDTTYNLWKLNLDSNVTQFPHIGDTIYQKDSCWTPQVTKYAYLVADHAVESITNVKVDGIPVEYTALTDLSPLDFGVCSDWNLPLGKAYVLVSANAGSIGKTGSDGLAIEDTIAVDDTIDVNDSIAVDEPGHEHDTSSGVRWYEHTIHFNYKYVTSGIATINISSGSFSTQILNTKTGVAITSPISFTSSSEKVLFVWNASGGYSGVFYFVTFKGRRLDDTGAVSYLTESVGSSTYGSTLFLYPPGIGGEATSNVKADVVKIGEASKTGAAVKTGTVKLIGGNSAADVLVGQTITCDVIGICDGSTGYVKPHNQIEKFINQYARNPISGTEGSANITGFSNESEMDTAFDKVYNTDNASKSATTLYPLLNIQSTEANNPSPTKDLGNIDTTEGFHCLDFAITEPNRFRDIVGDMLFHSNATLNWRNGVAQIKYNGDTLTEDGTIVESDLIMKSMSLARSKASDLATEVNVRYDYSQSKDFGRRYEHAERTGTGSDFVKTKLDATRVAGTYSRERAYDLPMARDQVSAEFVSKRLYDDKSAPKFEAGVTTVLKNLAFEVGDYVTTETPIYTNGVLDKGLVTSRTLEFGSAVDQQPDLIHLTVKENHTDDGFHLRGSTLTDSLSISDSTPVILFNDVHTFFTNLTDSLAITESIDVQPVQSLTDSLSITESMAFEYEVALTDTVAIIDEYMAFTGILFWDVSLTDSISMSDSTPVITFPELVTTEAGEFVLTETGDYLETE
jgi:hypothetical protein